MKKKLMLKRAIIISIRLLLFAVVISSVTVLLWSIKVERAIFPNAQLITEKTIYKSYEKLSFRLKLSPEEKKNSLISKAFADEDVKVKPVLEASGKELEEIKVEVEKVNSDEYIISADPPNKFRPGKYTLKAYISNPSGENVIIQDFLWGVLAMNPNKSVYKPSETAKISIGVLDERGVMVCDAKVKLEIRSPAGQRGSTPLGVEPLNTLSTENGTIKVNKECESYEYTLTPDYETSFKLGQEGDYKLTLTAETNNGTHTIEELIRVQNSTPFEIERESATRIYPLNLYPMNVKITANEDFAGSVTELIPSGFHILESHQDNLETDYAAFTKDVDEGKTLAWDVNWKKGETHTLSYIYDAPDVSPEFYLMGNLKLSNGFSEDRLWQIANDAAGTLFANADISTTNWTSGTCTSDLWDCINEGTASPNDSDTIQTSNGVTDGDYVFTSTSSPGNVGTVTDFTITVRAQKTGGRTATLDVFYSTDGSDPSITIGSQATLTESLFDYTFTATSLSLTKAQIDALRIKFRGNAASSGAGGATAVQVTASQTDITYDIATVSVSGNVFNAGTSTALTECDGDSGTHELSLRTEGVTYTTSCSSADGSYTFTSVIPGSAGSGMIIWIDDAQAPETDGAIAIRYDGSGDSASNTFYDDTVTVTSDDTNGVDILDMDTWDTDDGETDIPYTATDATPDTLVVNSGYELLVKIKSGVSAGSTVFSPNGTVATNATGGDLHIDDDSLAILDTATNSIGRDILIDTGATLRINASTTVGGGDMTTAGTGVITTTAGTGTVTISGTGNIGGGGSVTVYALAVNGSQTAASTITTNNSITVGSAGTFTVSGQNINSAGNFTNTTTGTIACSGTTGTVTMTGGGTLGSGSGDITFCNLATSTTGTTNFSGSGTNTVNGDVTAGSSTTLNINSNLAINGGDLTSTGAVGYSGTPTLTISGTGNIGGGSTLTAYNLQINGGQTAAGTITADNSITVGSAGTFTVSGQNINSAGNFTNTTTGVIACSGTTGTVTMTGGGTLGSGSGAITFCDLETSGSGTTNFSGAGTNTVNDDVSVGAGTTLNINSSISIAGDLANTTTGIIGTSAGTPTVTMTGTGSIGGGTTGTITLHNLTTSGTGTVTFTNGGTNTVNSNISVGSGTTLNINSNITITGSLTNTTTGIIGTTAGTPTVTVNGTTVGGGSGAITIHNLTVGVAGTVTFSGDGTNTITDTLAVNAGTTLSINSNVSIGANLTNATSGVITTSGTPTITMTGTGNIGGGTTGAITLYNLSTSGTGTTTFTNEGTNTVNNDISVDAGTTLNINSSVSIAGNLNNTTTGIIGTTAGTPTVTMTGSSKTLGTGTGAIALHNLSTTGTAAITFSGSGTNTVNSNVSVGSGTTLNINSSLTIAGSLTNATDGVINTTAGTPTVTVQGSSIGGGTTGAITFHNLTKSGAGTTTFSNGGTNTVNNNLTVSAGTLTQSSTLSVTGDVSVAAGATFNTNATLNIAGGDFTTTTTGIVDTTGGTSTVTISGTGNVGAGSGGSFTVYNLTINGTQTLTGAGATDNDVTVGSSGTFNINADLTIAGGDLTTTTTATVDTTGGTPTVTVSGTGNIGGGSNTVTVYNLTVSGTQTLQSAVATDNDLNVATGDSLALNNENVSSAGDFATTGTGTITCSGCSAGTVTLTGTGNIGGGGTVTVYNLTSSSGTQTVSSATTALNDLTVNGTINGSSNTTVNGSVLGTGTISMSGGTFDQRVAAAEAFGTTSGANNWTFSTLTFTNSSGSSRTITADSGGSGTITASTLLQVGAGGDSAATVLDAADRTWILAGTSGTPFTIPNGSVTVSTSTFSYTGDNGGGNTNIADIDYYNLTVNSGAEIYVPAASPLDITNELTVTAGTLDMGTDNLNVGSSGVANSGDISVSGTLTQSASGTTTILSSSGGAASIGGSGSITFYDLDIAPAVASAPTITLGNGASQTITITNDLTIGNGSNGVTVTALSNDPTIDVNGDFTVAANGAFTASDASPFRIATNFTNNGTFTHSSGTVTLDSSNTSIIDGSGSPAITFFNLTSIIPGKSIQFTAGKTFTIATSGNLTLVGEAGNRLIIDSTTSSQWFINHQGTESISYTRVSNSGCDGSSTDVTVDGTGQNGGNNDACWIFEEASVPARIQGATRIGGSVRFR